MKEPQDHSKQTKRYLSASGSILLPLALKWRSANKATIAMCGSFVALILSGLISGSALAASLTVVIPNMPLAAKVSPNGKGATSDPAIVKVSGDVNWGYELKLKSQSGSNDLTSGTNKLPSISDYKDDVSAFDNNTWGYKITGGSISEKRFRPGPSTDTTIDTTTIAVSSAAPTEYQVTLAAKVDASQPAGKYSGTFVFTVTAKTVNYSITYNLVDGTGGPNPTTQTGTTDQKTVNISSVEPTKADHTFKGWCSKETTDATCPNGGTTYAKGASYTLVNGANTLSLWAMWQDNRTHYSIAYNLNGGKGGPASPQTGATMAATVNLEAETPTKAGYTFKGWCNANNSTNPATCSGTTYQAGGTYTLIKNNANAVTLYAIWEQPTMQNFKCTIGDGEVTELIDKRGGVEQKYKVRKLKDGKCWMVENLRLGGNQPIVLTSADTDLNGISSFTLPASANAFSNSPYNNPYINTSKINTVEGGSPIGVYYNWPAATAGTGTASMSSGNATSSICPKGWRLPTGNPGGDFQVLYQAYSSNYSDMRNTNGPNFQLSGHYNSSSVNYLSSYGSWWSSTTLSSLNAYNLYINLYSVYPAHNSDKFYGYSVRCVAR